MRFAVVACPKCRRVQVFETRTMNVGCRACGTSFPWHERKLFYQGEDSEQARRVAAQVSVTYAGAGIEALAESVAAMERERTSSLDDVVEALARREEFGASDVEEELSRLKVKASADRVLERLRASQRVFEPRPGRFRWLA